MTISGSGFNPSFLFNDSIYKDNVGVQKQLQKEANIGVGNVVIVPQSEQDLIPLTNLAKRNTWNYKSESGHPSLLPMGQLRGSGAVVKGNVLGWETHYIALFDALPIDVKQELEYNLESGEAFKEMLKIAAKLLAWQELSEISSSKENALKQVEINQNFADTAFKNALMMGSEMALLGEKWLEILGANHPGYLSGKEELNQFTSLLQEIHWEEQAK